MGNAKNNSLLIFLLLTAAAVFGNYQSPTSTSPLPAWPNPSLSSYQSPAPDPGPTLLLVYDESQTLDLIALQSEENAPIRLFEAVSCEASAENIFGGEKSGGWSQNRVRWDLGSIPQDAITTGFVGVREIEFRDHTRYYDPELGRFTQPDPMGYADSMNLYQAFGQSPMNFGDPMGLVTSITAETGLPADIFSTVNYETGMPWLDYTVLGVYNTLASGAGRVVNYGWNAVAGVGWGIEQVEDFAVDHLGASRADIECLNLYLMANPAELALAANSLRIGGAQAVEKLGELLQRAKRVGTVEGRVAQGAPALPNMRQAGYIRLQGTPVAVAEETTVTPWGTRDLLTGKFTKGPRAGIDPVDDFIAQANANGYEVVSREITFRTPFENRRIDVLLRHPVTKKIFGVELKSTAEEFAKLNVPQNAADRYINLYSASAVGEKARAAGVTTVDSIIKILWEAPH